MTRYLKDTIQDLPPLPVDGLTQEQMNRAKKTVAITVEVDGQKYKEEYDTTRGFVLFIDREDTDGVPVTQNRALATDLMMIKSLISIMTMMENSFPMFGLLSSEIRKALLRRS
ncbi:hypothetical protein [Anaeroselena agilis]|uniref:Uncharacterized protein n=1 Tax=Anaeroselena agilis TaxID=3063788 RepID=A0ABU3NWE6_9FIRM|nr:hypothetical protein [Selenomonadales bacterium 4137-cl]